LPALREQFIDKDYQGLAAGVFPGPGDPGFEVDGRIATNFHHLLMAARIADGECAGAFGHIENNIHGLGVGLHPVSGLKSQVDKFVAPGRKKDPPVEFEWNAGGVIQ